MGWSYSTYEGTQRSDREIRPNEARYVQGGYAYCRTSFDKRAYWVNGKIVDSTYVKADLKQVYDNATQMNNEEINQLFSLLGDFKELFDSNLGDWATDPGDLGLKLGYKPFNSRY